MHIPDYRPRQEETSTPASPSAPSIKPLPASGALDRFKGELQVRAKTNNDRNRALRNWGSWNMSSVNQLQTALEYEVKPLLSLFKESSGKTAETATPQNKTTRSEVDRTLERCIYIIDDFQPRLEDKPAQYHKTSITKMPSDELHTYLATDKLSESLRTLSQLLKDKQSGQLPDDAFCEALQRLSSQIDLRATLLIEDISTWKGRLPTGPSVEELKLELFEKIGSVLTRSSALRSPEDPQTSTEIDTMRGLLVRLVNHGAPLPVDLSKKILGVQVTPLHMSSLGPLRFEVWKQYAKLGDGLFSKSSGRKAVLPISVNPGYRDFYRVSWKGDDGLTGAIIGTHLISGMEKGKLIDHNNVVIGRYRFVRSVSGQEHEIIAAVNHFSMFGAPRTASAYAVHESP